MKYIIFATIATLTSVLILSFSGSKTILKPENFTVIKVDGKIRIVKTGKELSTGLLFLDNEKLSFETPESRAAVISSKGGRFVLVPNAKSGKASNLLPAMSNVATRSGALLNTLNIINYFGEDFLLLDSLGINIPSGEFEMNEKNFFYLKYIYQDDTIAKKIPYDGQDLILSAKNIYTIDSELVEVPEKSEVKLYYTRGTTNKGVYLTSFILWTPSKEQLKTELSIIKNSMSKQSADEKREAIMAYLYQFYGSLQKKNIEDWMESNFNI